MAGSKSQFRMPVSPNQPVLLHICCAPCATTVIRRLRDAGYAVLGYFYNPNIQPEKEYYQRLLETQRLCKLWSIPLEVGDYDRDRWQAVTRGLETEPEGGERCVQCFRYRLEATAQQARLLSIELFATTLTISPHKDAALINSIGKELAEESARSFLEADWKKQDGFKESLQVCRELAIYRQEYCGCQHSIRRSFRPDGVPSPVVPKRLPSVRTRRNLNRYTYRKGVSSE